MLRGLYTAAAGMLATTVSTDTLAANLANVNTVGFKGNKTNYQTFPEMMINRVSKEGTEAIGNIMTGSKVYESFVNFAPGAMRQTGNTFDMALQGDAFFTVKSATGELYYTRAGNFTINESGFLATPNGDYVQGTLGNIQLQLDGGPFSVTPQGAISGKQGVIDKLAIVKFANNQALSKVSDNLYKTTPNSQQLPDPTLTGGPADFKIFSGSLEESNVNPVAELVNNIQGLRLYEALQKNIRMHNDTLGKAVNEVGRTR